MIPIKFGTLIIMIFLWSLKKRQLVSQPETVTVYFYSALKNVCITSDGPSVTTEFKFKEQN